MNSEPSSFTSPSAVASRRLAATARHLNSSSTSLLAASSASSTSSSNGFTSSSGSDSLKSKTNESGIKNVTIFGAGLMGAGIAQVAITQGFQVTLCDIADKPLELGRQTIEKGLAKRAKNPAEILSRLTTTTDTATAVAEADLVIEAIVENMAIKQKLFAAIEAAAKPSCILVSNTSSLPITEIGSKLGDESRKRFGGLHFFSPVPMMKLVEVIRTNETSDQAFDALFAFGKELGKVPVACKDTPGFIVNRLLIPYIREAFAMLERGDATAKDIDTAMKLGAGHPMGPLELQDAVGLDIAKAIGDGWRERAANGDPNLSPDLIKPSRLIDDLVAQGKLGRKTGEGVYKYGKK